MYTHTHTHIHTHIHTHAHNSRSDKIEVNHHASMTSHRPDEEDRTSDNGDDTSIPEGAFDVEFMFNLSLGSAFAERQNTVHHYMCTRLLQEVLLRGMAGECVCVLCRCLNL